MHLLVLVRGVLLGRVVWWCHHPAAGLGAAAPDIGPRRGLHCGPASQAGQPALPGGLG